MNDSIAPSESGANEQGKKWPQNVSLSFDWISHHIGNKSIGQAIIEDKLKADIYAVEGSIYLGGFIPPEAPLEKIQVLLEAPSTFFKDDASAAHLAAIYFKGNNIPKSSRGYRRLFETIASEISSEVPRRELMRIVHELLYLRAQHPNVVVYNEPEAWLRTVWYEADLLFQYILAKKHFKLFGAYICSDLDVEFIEYMTKSAAAISALTADDVLLFTFASQDKESELGVAAEYVAYRCVLETPGRLKESMTPAQLDEMRDREMRMLSHVSGRNRSLLFGRRLGVTASQTPCIVFWTSLDDGRFVTLCLGQYADDRSRSIAIKALADIIATAVASNDGDVLDLLLTGISDLESHRTDNSIGDILRSFLDESSNPRPDSH